MRCLVDTGPWVITLGNQRGDRHDRVVVGVRAGKLGPGERHRHGRDGCLAGRVRRGEGAIPRVLVVVDEQPLAALFLPPGRGDRIGRAAFDLAGQRDPGPAHLDEIPVRLDPDEHVHAPPTRCLRIPHVAEFVEDRFQHLHRNPAGVGEVRTRLRVQIDPQFIGMVGVRAAHRPRVQCHRAHLGRPRNSRRMGDLQRVGGAAGWERDRTGLQIVRMLLWDPLLVDLLAVDTVGEAL